MAPNHHVLDHAHAEENLQVLERAGQPASRQLMWREICDIFAG
jgi:hypothetical protein